jgi:hypothetical protein
MNQMNWATARVARLGRVGATLAVARKNSSFNLHYLDIAQSL